jgi:hypothetical protein
MKLWIQTPFEKGQTLRVIDSPPNCALIPGDLVTYEGYAFNSQGLAMCVVKDITGTANILREDELKIVNG